MAAKIIWSPEAFSDLKAINEYISRDSAAIAGSVVERLLDAIDRLADFPLIGPRIREWRRSPYRHVIVSPYRVIYRVDRDAVVIIAIVLGARDLKRYLRGRSGR